MKASIFFALLCFCVTDGYGQAKVRGTVQNNADSALGFATLVWLSNNQGVSSDEDGRFEMDFPGGTQYLIVSKIGYLTDTFEIYSEGDWIITLAEDNILGETQIEGRQPGTYSLDEGYRIDVVTDVELEKGACCDLAGCFNTEPSVDPVTTNIITQNKELRILGQDGNQSQLLLDGAPQFRGLAFDYGLSTVPGPWINKIFIAKGANSVQQGHDGVSGQINVIGKTGKTHDDFQAYFHLSENGSLQNNLQFGATNGKWSSFTGTHLVSPHLRTKDVQKDGFVDLPKRTSLGLWQQLHYGNEKEAGWAASIKGRIHSDDRVGGQDPLPSSRFKIDTLFRSTLNLLHTDFQFRLAHASTRGAQWLLLANLQNIQRTEEYGTRGFDGLQVASDFRLQYLEPLTDDHSLRAGLTLNQMYNESKFWGVSALDTLTSLVWDKVVPGLYLEPEFRWLDDRLICLFGLRADYLDGEGLLPTIRTVTRWEVNELWALRASFGTAWKDPMRYGENLSWLASQHILEIEEGEIFASGMFDTEIQKSWNAGLGLTYSKRGENWRPTINFSTYYSQLNNLEYRQYSADSLVRFAFDHQDLGMWSSQLELKFSHTSEMSFLLSYTKNSPLNLDAAAHQYWAYRTLDLVQAVVSLPFAENWRLDLNGHFYGPKHLLNLDADPLSAVADAENMSEAYLLLHGQVAYAFESMDLFLGVENVTDYFQNDPIRSASNPKDNLFDAGHSWGPGGGREVYLGARINIRGGGN